MLDLVTLGLNLIDKIIPDPQAKQAAQLQLLQLQQSGDLAQLNADTTLATGQDQVNLAEANSNNIFESGWRPFIGWVCGSGLAYQFIVSPLLSWGSSLAGYHIIMPTLDIESLMTCLLGMLGLGGMRTYEKIKGVTK